MKESDVQLKRGDIFLSRNPMMLGRIINFWQALWAKDRKATKSHAGIILDEKGTTFEALWTVKSQNLWEAYKGQEVLIGRPATISEDDIERGIAIVENHKGQRYPFYRFLFFIVPPIARRVVFRRLVCSELTCKYLYFAGLTDIVWAGKVPDDIEEMILYHKDFEIVYRGRA